MANQRNLMDGPETAADGGFTLVRAGAANASIAWFGSEAAVPAFAAGELSDYVARMTGARLPVAPCPVALPAGQGAAGGLVIIADPSPEPSWQGPLDAALHAAIGQSTRLLRDSHDNGDERDKTDSYAITSIGEHAVLVLGTTFRAVLYATYDILYRLGVRFFAPRYDFYEGRAEAVPRAETLTLERLRVVERPAFRYRRKYVEEGWSHTPDRLRCLIDWMAKTRLNILVYPYDYVGEGVVRWDMWRHELIAALRDRDMLLEVGGHGYESFLPPASFPQYYTSGTPVFDVHDDHAVRAYTDNVVDYLRRRPEIAVFDAWPSDDGAWPPAAIERYGSVANAHAHVTNVLQAAVAEAGLPVRVAALAYAKHTDPPASELALSPSVLVDIAPYDRSYARPISDHAAPTNGYYDNLMRAWRSGHPGRIGIYEYYRKYSWHSLPVLLLELLPAELTHYRSLGCDGFGTYSEPGDWLTYEVVHLLVAQLSWKVDLDTQAWLHSYTRERYGNAAPALEIYFMQVEAAGRVLFDRPDGDYGSRTAVAAALAAYRLARQALTQAISLVATGSAEEFLLKRLQGNIEFALADTEIDNQRLRGDERRTEAARQATRALVEHQRLSGTVLDSVWTRRRYGLDGDRQSCREVYDAYRAPPAQCGT